MSGVPAGRSCPMNVQAVGWVLRALEPEEEVAVRAHLPGCASCRETVRETEAVLGALGGSVEQADPPERLRGAILALAAETPQAPPPAVAPSADPGTPGGNGRDRGTSGGNVRDSGSSGGNGRDPGTAGGNGRHPRQAAPGPRPPSRPAVRPPRRRRRLLAAALALAGVVAVGGLAARTAQLQEQRDAQAARAETLASLITRLDQPGSRLATLAGADSTPVAAVVVTGGQSTLVATGLPPNEREQIYVAWGLGAGDPRAIGTFDVDPAAVGVHSLGSVPEAGGYSGYAISLEAGRAAPASPSQPVASGQVES